MEPLSTFLSSLLGKVVAGSAVAAATVAGVNVADVELPDLSDKPAEVTTDDEGETSELPTESQTGQEAAEAGADNADIADEKRQNDEGGLENEGENDAETGESQGIGDQVSALASDGDGVTRDEVLPLTPANERAHDAGAPEDAGERQDAAVRQDEGAGQDDEAPQDAEVAEEQTPEEPGSQADGRRGGAAAESARP